MILQPLGCLKVHQTIRGSKASTIWPTVSQFLDQGFQMGLVISRVHEGGRGNSIFCILDSCTPCRAGHSLAKSLSRSSLSFEQACLCDICLLLQTFSFVI